MTRIKAGRDDKACGVPMWKPITTAPFGRLLELAIIDDEDELPLAFPCRRTLSGWRHAMNGWAVDVHPTHWREWRGADGKLIN